MTEERKDKGIQETKELIDLGFSLAEIIKKHLADGVDPKDVVDILVELLTSADFKAKLLVAITGIKEIPSELIDIKKVEFFQLVMHTWSKLKELSKK
jgi:hypothetical protein